MVAPNTDSEQVRYDILIEAQQAIKALQDISRISKDNTQRIEAFTDVVLRSSKAWGVSWQQALATYKQLNAELSQQKKANIFGPTGGKDIFGETGKYITALESAGRLQDNVAKSAKEMGTAIEDGTTKGTHGINTMRIAMGVFVSMLISQAIQAVTTFFKEAIDQAKQFETTLYRLSNAERQLSVAGLEVSLKGLKKGITDIQDALPIFSKEDISELIGSLAISTKELGFNEEQILKLGAAISILNINSSETESLLQTQAKVTNSLISPQAKSIGALGLSFGKANIEAKAFKMDLLEIGETFEDLTEKEKTEVKYQIVLDTANIGDIGDISELRDKIKEAGGDFEALNEYLNSNTGRLAENASAWKDLQTAIGQFLLPFLPAITAILDLIEKGIQGGKVLFSVWAAVVGAVGSTYAQLAKGNIELKETLAYFKFALKDLAAQWLYAFFPEIPAGAPKWFTDLYEKTVGNRERETPTGITTPERDTKSEKKYAEEIQRAEEKVTDAMKDARDKRLDLERDYQNKLLDINRDYSRKLIDIARNTEDKRDDALRNYSQKVEDINRDTNQKVADARDEAKEKELDREREFQQKLKELQDKFLFDLEDALHERDARQVLRLIRQYNRDKQNIIDRHNIERAESTKDLQRKVADLEQERKLKLESARREYEEKLVEIGIGERRALEEAAIWKQRALEDARIWHQRQLQEQRDYLQRKLQDIATALGRELQMNNTAAQAMAGLWSNAFASILTGFNSSISGLLTPNIGTGGAITGGSFTNPNAGWQAQAQTWQNSGMYGTGFEEGGTLIATHPTTATFGEVPEAVTFTPLDGGGNNVGRIFGDNPNQGGAVEILLTLSPDLEHRIVQKSMDGAADVLVRVNRTKV